jgi:hypothetical protein
MTLEFPQRIFPKTLVSNFVMIRPVGAYLNADGRRIGRTDVEKDRYYENDYLFSQFFRTRLIRP